MISENEYQKHVQESMKLTPEGYRNLYVVHMRPEGQPEIIVTLTAQASCTWQGRTYEDWACHLSGFSQDSSGEVSRPKFSIGNVNGVFNGFVHQGWLDNAEVTRYRVLKSHLEANVNSFVKHTWRVAKIVSLTGSVVVTELRGVLDGHNFIMPGRAFQPPEFKMVSM